MPQSWIIGPQLIGIIFIILGLIQLWFPPKHINKYYGYKMPSAMKNQQTWDEANRYATRYTIKCGLVLIVAGILTTTIFKVVVMPFKMKEAFTILVFLFSGMFPAIAIIVATEKHLSKVFGNSSE
jgi:uncharacterized membrane protein